MVRTRGLGAESKSFNKRRYKYYKGLPRKSDATRLANKLRKQGNLARVTREDYSGGDYQYIVWVR